MKPMYRKIAFIISFLMMIACTAFLTPAHAASTLTISSPSSWSVHSWDDSLTIKWNSVSGAAGYYVTIKNDSTGAYYVQNKWTTSRSFSASSYLPESIATLKIWVGAVESSSQTGAEAFTSDIIYIYNSHEPDITNGSVSSITETSAKLSMTINKDYGYSIDDWGFYVGTSSSISKMTQYSYGYTAKGTKTATITGLSPNTTYYYRAYAENEAGEEYTTAKSFTTKAANLDDPVITYPVNGNSYSNGSSIKLQWNAVDGVDGYRYYIKQLSGAPDYSSTSEPSVNSWEGSVSSSRTYYTLSASNVVGGYWYKFVVEAYASGVDSSWSNWVYVYAQGGSLDKPVIVSPVDTATYTAYKSIKLDWNPVSNASSYKVFIKRLDGMPDRTNDNETGTSIVNGASVSSSVTEYTISANQVTPGKWYKFVVEALADGMDPSWSQWTYCYVNESSLANVEITSPVTWSQVSAGNSLTIKWNSVSGANGYWIYWKQLSGMPDTSNDSEPAIYAQDLDCKTALKYTVSSDRIIGGYWYKFVVKAYATSMQDSWSNWVYVYVPENGDLDRPVITSPVAGQNYETGNDIRFTWTKVDNATSYTYYIKQLVGEPDYSDNEKASNSWSGTTRAAARSYTLSGANVQPNTWYKFVVKAEASGYNSSWSRYTYIKIPDRVDWIHFVMPNAMTNVSEEAFAGNKLLRTFDASNSNLSEIESRAFANCTNLLSINLPISVGYIAGDAFENCPSLTIHCIKGSYAENYANSKGIPTEIHGVAIDTDVMQVSENDWTIPSFEAAYKAVRVTSSGTWSASSNVPWLTLSSKTGTDGTNVILNATKNTTKATRTGKVTFTCGSATAVITVIQNASPASCGLSVSIDTWIPTSEALTRDIFVESDNGFTVSSNKSWLTFTKNSGTITAKVTAASLSTAQSGILTITCSDCGASKTVTVTTKGDVVPVPTNLHVESIDPETLKISWNTVSGASYYVERSEYESSGYKKIKDLNTGVTSFLDSGLISGKTYWYRVYATKIISGNTYNSVASVSASNTTSTQAILKFTGTYGNISDDGRMLLANLETLSWSSLDNAKTYKVSLRNKDTNQIVSGWDKKDVGKVNSVSLVGLFSDGVSYRVWVGAFNEYGHLIGQTVALEFTALKDLSEPVQPAKITTNKELQIRLSELSCYSGYFNSKADGVLGTGSRGAVWFFEALHGLPLSNLSSNNDSISKVNSATLQALSNAKESDYCGAKAELSTQEILSRIDSSSVIQSGKKTACKKMAQLLLEEGKEPAFVAGVLANINHEGNFGFFEGTNKTETSGYKKIINSLGYYDTYSFRYVYKTNKKGENITLNQLISDLTRYENAGGMFGIGCIQWTEGRGAQLIRNHYNAKANGGVITELQVIEAEMEMFDAEINGKSGYDYYSGRAYPAWKAQAGNHTNSAFAAVKAAQIFHDYAERSAMIQSSMSARYNTAIKLYAEWVR